jgi:hypothetical protein
VRTEAVPESREETYTEPSALALAPVTAPRAP